jgi:nucleoside-diphosphate-sugar epimerase
LKNKVLIIGGCGYIGSSLFNFLQNKGLNVDTIDLEWFGNHSVHKNINLDYKSLTKDFLSKYDSIVLLAAHSSVRMCENAMMPAFKNNVVTLLNFLKK